MMIQRKRRITKKIRISVFTETKMISTLCSIVIDIKQNRIKLIKNLPKTQYRFCQRDGRWRTCFVPSLFADFFSSQPSMRMCSVALEDIWWCKSYRNPLFFLDKIQSKLIVDQIFSSELFDVCEVFLHIKYINFWSKIVETHFSIFELKIIFIWRSSY